jgi:transketolase
MDKATLDQNSINTIRFLALDAVQKAKSGHAGTPMGAATLAYTLWDRLLKHNPRNPAWPDRDRFVLSAGHASMLLYSLLHLTGYDLPLEELRGFRQWGSRTAGHQENWLTPGVEATTGPLGQGFANGVGMAIAERWLAAQYNRPGHEVVDHYTYALVSDGDMQEGVSGEAASLAGTLKLGKLIYFYDDNEVQIDGPTDWVFTENVGRRFEAYGWQVLGPIDGDDMSAVEQAVKNAQAETERPSLVICRTTIGHGSPIQGTAKAHSDPMKDEAVQATKETLGWPQDPTFRVPEEVAAHMRRAVDRGERAEAEWRTRMDGYARAYPGLAAALQAQLRGELPDGWDDGLAELFPAGTAAMATRAASGKVLNALATRVPALIGGSADLGGSTKTLLEETADFGSADYRGRNLRFGVREHAMGAIAGGMALHGGTIPYTGTFLVFSDYMRPPMRLAALSHARVVYLFTHDSIGVGEDGPTHQPVEHLMSLRAVPNLTVIRPADATETAEAWRMALLNSGGPTAIILTRQDVPALDRMEYASAEGLRRGAYALWQSAEGEPELILIGTGSEVHLAMEAGKRLGEEGVGVRVVSMPSWELFDQQPPEYREGVLPPSVRRRVAIEAGVKLGWERYVGLDGAVVGMEGFGASAPGRILFEQFGFTADRVAIEARALLAGETT